MTRRRTLFLFALLVGYLLTGVAPVKPEERAVVRRFGRVVARPGPGLWVGLPWGIDRVDRIPVRTVRQLAVGTDPDTDEGSVFLTGDENLVGAKLIVEYAVDETDAGLDDHLANRDRVDELLGREAEALAAEWLGGRTVDEALLAGRATLPTWLMARLPDRLTPHRLGIVVQRVSVAALAAPPEVREAFDQVNQAQTGIRTKENQAEQDAARRRADAAAVKYRSEQQATAYRDEQVRAATADRDTFLKRLEQYRTLKATNPDVLAGIWWDEMGRTLVSLKGRGRIDVLDHHLGADGLDVTQFVAPKKR